LTAAARKQGMQNNNNNPYSTDHWLTTGFAAAKQQAMEQSKLIFLVLHSPLSPESNQFCQSILPLLQSFTTNANVLALGFDIHSAQGAQLAQLLQAKAFPLLMVLQAGTTSSSQQHLTVLFRVEGNSLLNFHTIATMNNSSNNNDSNHTTALLLTTYLHTALARHEAIIAEETSRRITREQEAVLRRTQDEEYQEALRMDRLRVEQATAQELQRVQEEEHLKALVTAKQTAIAKAREMVGEEPAQGGCMVRFVLPSGSKLNRRFANDATIQVLKAYLQVYFHDNEMSMGCIGLSTSFPRKTYNDESEQQLTLEEAGLAGQAVLMVQDLDA
jgi:FAS-associated factor 2